jgi:hypothetical protein
MSRSEEVDFHRRRSHLRRYANPLRRNEPRKLTRARVAVSLPPSGPRSGFRWSVRCGGPKDRVENERTRGRCERSQRLFGSPARTPAHEPSLRRYQDLRDERLDLVEPLPLGDPRDVARWDPLPGRHPVTARRGRIAPLPGQLPAHRSAEVGGAHGVVVQQPAGLVASHDGAGLQPAPSCPAAAAPARGPPAPPCGGAAGPGRRRAHWCGGGRRPPPADRQPRGPGTARRETGDLRRVLGAAAGQHCHALPATIARRHRAPARPGRHRPPVLRRRLPRAGGHQDQPSQKQPQRRPTRAPHRFDSTNSSSSATLPRLATDRLTGLCGRHWIPSASHARPKIARMSAERLLK